MDKIASYRIVRQLGQGGMGVVYEGMNDQISRRVAIKVLHKEVSENPDLLARFFNEARACNLASHPSIVDVYELGQLPDGRAYIVMQFLAGESLADRLKRRDGRLPIPEAIRLIRQVASAMAAAHSKGIIHRDLKPDNVMIVEDSEAPGGERAKIVDFGIAKLLTAADEKGDQRRTRAGTVMGTPAYMAPEQCRGSEGVTEKSDVYSLGVMLYESLSSRTPFLASGTGEMLAKQIYEQPTPLWELDASLPADLVALVHDMLHKQPTARPSMTEVASRLAAQGAPQTSENPMVRSLARSDAPAATPRHTEALDASSAAPPVTPAALPAPVGPTPKRSRRALLGAALAGSLLLAGGARLLLRSGAQRPQPGPTVAAGADTSELGPDKKRDAAPTVPARAATIHWSITTQPAGAQVVDAVSSRSLGVTPLELDRPPEAGIQTVVLRLQGHQEHTLRLLADRAESRRVSLVPVEPPAEVKAPLEAKKSSKSHRSSKVPKNASPPNVGTPMTDEDVKVVQ